MNTDNKFTWFHLVVVAVITGFFAGITMLFMSGMLSSSSSNQLGIGGLYAENYLPFITFNQGYNSTYGITTEATLTAEQVTSSDDLTVTDDAVIGGEITALAKTEGVAAANVLTAAESGTTYFASSTSATTTLPAVGTAGMFFRFQVGAAIGNGNWHVDSAEGDNINGMLTVNNADVVCAGEDQIQFITDGEVVGDYFELISDGNQWLIVSSDAQTAAKITCTDPT